MSTRTRTAIEDVCLPVPDHRSHQATADLLANSDLIVAAAPEHVAWVRREHPVASGRTATLLHLVAALDPSDASAPVPGDADRLRRRVRALDLASHQPSSDEEIIDPGGGEVDLYVRVARQIVALVDDLAPRL